MSSFRVVLLSAMLLGQAAAWERNSGKANMRCEWLKKEMAKGAKPWLTKQRWYARVARSCGIPLMISDAEAPAMEEPARFGLGGGPGELQPQKLAQLAKMALADPASQHKAQAEAMKLAQMARMALMKNPKAQASMQKGMDILKTIEEKKKDGSWKKDAEHLANKAKGHLRKRFGPEFESEAGGIAEKAQELLKSEDIQTLGNDAMAFLNKAMSKHKDLADKTSKFAQMAAAKMQEAHDDAPFEQSMWEEKAIPAQPEKAMRMQSPQYGMPAMRPMPTERDTIQV